MRTSASFRFIVVSALVFGIPVVSSARGVSPYLPLNMSPAIERDIERVLVFGDRPVLTRPIPAAAVLDALPGACEIDPAVCRRVRRYLERYMRSFGVVEAAVEVAAGEGQSAIPNQRGTTYDGEWAASVSAYWQPFDHALVSLSGVAHADDANPAGSMLSLGFEYAQIDIGYRDHWMSPFVDHAMFISTHAPTLPSITLSNYKPISALGIRYEFFLAEMEETDRIVFGDGYTTGKPRVGGLHIGISPAPGWALGANRILQFGGGARGGQSFSDFMRAFFKPRESDNRSDSLDQDAEFGNQMASWTSSFVYPGRVPFSVYLEYAGEDTSYEGNYRLGNSALSIGIHFPSLWGKWDLTYEASDWQNGWYVHSIYQDGFTTDGHVLGHWGADARRFNDGVGAQSHTLKLGWEPSFGGLFQFAGRTIDNDDYTGGYERGYDLGVGYSRAFGDFLASVNLTVGRDVFGDSFERLAANVRWGDEWLEAGGSSSYPTSDKSKGELFAEVGAMGSRLRIHPGDTTPRVNIDSATPHIGIGARRAVSERSDLGVRVEFDRVEDVNLLSVRALDYRYRFRNPLAVSFFVGAARYDLATAAYGYQLGAGIEWRNLLPRVDAGLDLRYLDKMARDKLLASDRPTFPRPDIFYDLYAATFTLRYRW